MYVTDYGYSLIFFMIIFLTIVHLFIYCFPFRIKKKLRKEEPQDAIKNEVLEPQKVKDESIPEPEVQFKEEEDNASQEKARKM